MAQRYKFSIESKSFPLDISGEPNSQEEILFRYPKENRHGYLQ